MATIPPVAQIITPSAAAWLWPVSDARLRRLALDGDLPFVTIRGWGRKPSRAYSFAHCVGRWGDPPADRLALLLRLQLTQITGSGGRTWEVMVIRPSVLTGDGELAVEAL